ncbi:MAG TPA: TetR/AcrR family transcriptional regulator, partial [Rugosimonospora sp.]|nr:TetR/AcrR family transcriptional regulator [Rugosimonospora sp.]
MTVTRRRDEYAALTRAAIVAAAHELFAGSGFGSTSVDDIARAARVSKGAVYHHFTDKPQIFEEVFRAAMGTAMQRVGAAASGAGTPWEQALAGLDAFLDGCVEDAGWRHLLRQAPAAIGPDRCRAVNDDVTLPVVRAAVAQVTAGGALAGQPGDLTARVVFAALCE